MVTARNAPERNAPGDDEDLQAGPLSLVGGISLSLHKIRSRGFRGGPGRSASEFSRKSRKFGLEGQCAERNLANSPKRKWPTRRIEPLTIGEAA